MESKKMNKKKFDIFISHEMNVKDQVHKLYDVLLKEIKAKIWISKYQIKSSSIEFEDLRRCIDDSILLICCITKAYSLSKDCQDEIGYSICRKKKMLVLMFEDIDLTKDVGWFGLKILKHPRCNIYNCPNAFEMKSGPVFDECMTSIYSLLNIDKVVKTEQNKSFELNAEPKTLHNIEQEYLFIFENCSICNESLMCLNLWNFYYCKNCWKNLSCSICSNLVVKTSVSKGDDNKVICESCWFKLESESFDISNIIPDKKKLNIKCCSGCKQQEAFP